ncbi:MAG TPA: protein-L-isoaspartate(D-aspartate) O-methyltransferase [Planctomycetota bacterium]|nr:protein-L-isoaspartate(D-aspartate) O-methyltransferase [Planctomycetota bacterium]
MKHDDYKAARRSMVHNQLERRDIRDLRVLDAFRRVPRECFVREEDVDRAYDDRPIPIGYGQTISQPYMVALMTQCLELTGTEKVLEVGTGSGYQAAVLCELAADVYSIERHEPLSERAAMTLQYRGYTNFTLRRGDGTLGWPEQAPFDRIIVTAAAPQVPPSLLRQLADDGILVIPVGPVGMQMLKVIRRHAGATSDEDVCSCVFVKLIGHEGYHDDGPADV